MLQALHPLAMAGVADHSSYEDDPIGRLRRTANFVGTTTFGTTAEAREAISRLVAAGVGLREATAAVEVLLGVAHRVAYAAALELRGAEAARRDP